MNLYSRFLLILLATLLYGTTSFALNLKAIYTAACKREIGLILDVDEKNIVFLSSQKSMIKIPRYEIIYLADYPIDQMPSRGVLKVDQVPLVKIQTMENHKVFPLVEGWPIGFNAEKISFLKKNGSETVIDSENIWSVEFVEAEHRMKGRKSPDQYQFIHPYSFRECRYKNSGRKIYPQQILSDPIQIKRELDFLSGGFNRMRRYEREQDFYPVPQVHKNLTELGIWYSFGSRSGASDKRSNNLLPVLVDQYSSDIFDYQHYSVTGSAPLLIGTHEEPQPQIYYTFKASYFHFSVMVDPDLVLVGENYDWQVQDFDAGQADVRHNDLAVIELGFDFGHFALRAYGGSVLNLGIWDGASLLAEQMSFPRFGLKYTRESWWLEVNGGSGSKNLDNNRGSIDLSFARMNLALMDIAKMDFTLSLIKSDFEAERVSNFSSSGLTSALYVSRPITKRVRAGGFLSNEKRSAESSTSQTDESYFKAGINLFLNF